MARSPAPMYDRMTFDRYQFREYPKMLYAKGMKTKIVNNESEEQALDDSWFDTPGAMLAATKPGATK